MIGWRQNAANIHASTVAFGPRGGVMILGPSGTGKSRLALALIERGAQLVADDQTLVTPLSGALYARAPRMIAGQIEVRGMGILTMIHRRLARVVLLVDLSGAPGTRLPEPRGRDVAGITLPCLHGSPDLSFACAISRHMARLPRLE